MFRTLYPGRETSSPKKLTAPTSLETVAPQHWCWLKWGRHKTNKNNQSSAVFEKKKETNQSRLEGEKKKRWLCAAAPSISVYRICVRGSSGSLQEVCKINEPKSIMLISFQLNKRGQYLQTKIRAGVSAKTCGAPENEFYYGHSNLFRLGLSFTKYLIIVEWTQTYFTLLSFQHSQ